MKTQYTTPTVELEMLNSADVITTSEWTLPEVPVDGASTDGTTTRFNW